MLSFFAKLGLDVSPLKRALAQAVDATKEAGEKMGEHTGKAFSKRFTKYLGAGALIGTAVAGFNQLRSLRDLADAAHISMVEQMALEKVLARLGDTSSVTASEINRLAKAEIDAGRVGADFNEKGVRRLIDSGERLEETLNKAKGTGYSFVAMLRDLIFYAEKWVHVAASPAEGLFKGLLEQLRGGDFKGALFGAMRDAMKAVDDFWNTVPKSIAAQAARARDTGEFFGPPLPEGWGVARDTGIFFGPPELKKRKGAPLRFDAGGLTSIGLGSGIGAVSIKHIQERILKENREMKAELKKISSGVKTLNSNMV